MKLRYFLGTFIIGIAVCSIAVIKSEPTPETVDVTFLQTPGALSPTSVEMFYEDSYPEPNEPIEQKHTWGWGKIPKQNFCPHCGILSYTRFCTDCKKERGDIPFIGVYCPKCRPDGKYASQTNDVTEICGDCGSDRTWKYVYEDWQTEPEPNEPNDLEFDFESGVFTLTTPTLEGAVWLESDEIPPPSIFYYDGNKKIEYIPKPEPNEPKPDTSKLVGGIKKIAELIEYYHREPNEPPIKCKHDRPDPDCHYCWYYRIYRPEKSIKYSLPIPTWPEYIDLDKDLYIVIENRDYKPADKRWYFGKGTRIYFKEDKE